MLVPVLQMHQLVPQMKMIVLQQLVIHTQVVVQLDIHKMFLMYHVLELLVSLILIEIHVVLLIVLRMQVDQLDLNIFHTHVLALMDILVTSY